MTATALALSLRYNVPFKDLHEHVEDLLYRFTNRKLGDTVFRVGRDLPRKLSPDDRLIGAIRACRETGVNPAPLCAAVAAALRFSPDETSARPAQEILTEISKLSVESEEYTQIMKYAALLEGEDGVKNARAAIKRSMSQW